MAGRSRRTSYRANYRPGAGEAPPPSTYGLRCWIEHALTASRSLAPAETQTPPGYVDACEL
jgi:hypothetical protein